MNLVVVTLDDVDVTGPTYSGLKILDAQGDKFTQTISGLIDPLLNWLISGNGQPDIFSDRSVSRKYAAIH